MNAKEFFKKKDFINIEWNGTKSEFSILKIFVSKFKRAEESIKV